MRAWLDALWVAIPPIVRWLVTICVPLLILAFKWLRHRLVASVLTRLDGKQDELKSIIREIDRLSEKKATLWAQSQVELPELLKQYHAASPEDQATSVAKLLDWLACWRDALGLHTTHLAEAQLVDFDETQPSETQASDLSLVLLAAAFGNTEAAELLLESEIQALAAEEGRYEVESLDDQQEKWERMFASIQPLRREEQEALLAHSYEKGTIAYNQAKYSLAVRWVRLAYYLSKLIFGEFSPETATNLNNLAAAYQAQGEYAKALSLHERALKIREATLGDKHPDVAMSLNNLAMVYHEQGEYAKALPLHERALRIKEEALGNKHPAVAISLNNLAMVYQAQGEYAKALPLYESALKIREDALGDKHPYVASSLNGQASVYQAQGLYAKALLLHERALKISEEALGDKHPDVADSLNGLAIVYEAQGDYAKSLPLFERALKIREEALGDTHPKVATLREHLAKCKKLLS